MAKMTFVEYVGAYKDYKKSMGKSAKLSEAEFKGLRKEFSTLLKESKAKKKPALNESKDEVKVNSLNEAMNAMRAWKKENVGTSVLTEAEIAGVKKAYLEETKGAAKKPTSKYVEALRKYKAYKVNEKHDNSPITESERAAIKAQLREDAVIAKITEAKKLIRKAKRKLEEGDMMGAAGAVQGAGDAINGVGDMGMDPNAAPATPLPQNVVDEIQTIKTSVDALAQEAGIESPVDLGANASAGVPGAMDTTVPADPNAAPAGGMMESLSKTEQRIRAREARLAEGAIGADKGGKVPEPPVPQCSTGGNLESNAEEVKPGTAQQLLNGYATGPAAKEMAPAKRWPTKPIKAPVDKKLGNIEECEEVENEDEKLEESNSWADKHVEAAMKPKFDWNEFLNSRK